jgi:hypothetical protein
LGDALRRAGSALRAVICASLLHVFAGCATSSPAAMRGSWAFKGAATRRVGASGCGWAQLELITSTSCQCACCVELCNCAGLTWRVRDCITACVRTGRACRWRLTLLRVEVKSALSETRSRSTADCLRLPLPVRRVRLSVCMLTSAAPCRSTGGMLDDPCSALAYSAALQTRWCRS